MLARRLVVPPAIHKECALTRHQVQELSIDYTNCIQQSPETSATLDTSRPLKDIPGNRVSATFEKDMQTKPQWGHARDNYTWPISGRVRETDVCILSFNIPKQIEPPILFYYRLTNFYQNHRRYVKSVDIDQLKGRAKSGDDIKSGDCTPLNVHSDGRPYYPCGLIANSMFNDTFDNLTLLNPQGQDGGDSDQPTHYNFTTAGTSWAHEGDLYGKTDYKPGQVAVPPFWVDQFPEDGYDSMTELPNLHTWEQFQVWMRTAGLPTFSKLAQRNDNAPLKSGTYWLKIYDRTIQASPAAITC
jgi:hypothetical protein